jgi:ATP-dependent DNA helicase PIF1
MILELCLSDDDNHKLIDTVYPNLQYLDNLPEDDIAMYFSERVVLAAKNTDVDSLNEIVLDRLSGESKTYHSVDEAFDEGGNRDNEVPREYLNSIMISGMPLHLTSLKAGSVVILLRNLDYAGGLCNGTRLIIVDLGEHLIRRKILTGKHRGETAFIPRISLDTATSSGLPFTLRRCQFPLQLTFAMTINKSQGQSLKVVGIHLHTPVFSHGQLYVAISRATDCRQIYISLPPTADGTLTTDNIVYSEVFPTDV